MADNTTVWTFQQLSGNFRKLELSDHAAPHGRPRKKPIVEDEIKVLMDEVRMGESDVVRHIFGSSFEPITLNGRFDDSRGGKGFARAKAQEVKTFVDEKQPIQITWDNHLNATGIIERFKPSRESGGAIAYEIEIRLDGDDNLALEPIVLNPHTSPSTFMSAMQAKLFELPDPREIPTLRGSVFDAMDSLISAVNGVTAELAQTAKEIGDFVNAPFALLRRFRLGLEQAGTAIVRLRSAWDSLETNVALERQNAAQQQAFWDVESRWNTSLLSMLQDVVAADDAAARAEHGQVLALYTARGGDTWEGIARQFYGGPERADDIRAANGLETGVQPGPGTIYRIPR